MFRKFLFLSSHAHIRVHFGIREKLSLRSPFRCTFLFSKTFLCFDPWIFPRRPAVIFFQKRVVFLVFFLSFFFSFFIEMVCNLGKIVIQDYTLPKEQKGMWMKRNQYTRPCFFSLVFLIQTNHHNAIVRQYTRSGKVHHNEITKNCKR